jgi:hypothetical protein
MTKCECGCGEEIINPSKSTQRFQNMDHFNRYRKDHPTRKRRKSIVNIVNDPILSNVPNAPALPAQTLPVFEYMTFKDIKSQFMDMQVKMLELSSYKHKYLELLIKIKELLPKESEPNIRFISENGIMKDSIKGNISIKADGIPNLLRSRKKIIKPPIEEFITDNPDSIKLEPVHAPIIKSDDEIDDFKELDD